MKKKETVQITTILDGLDKSEIGLIKQRCTAKKYDAGKLNNLMEGKGLHIVDPIFILHCSSADKKPKVTMEKMKEKLCSIYLQSREVAYKAIIVSSPSKIHVLSIPVSKNGQGVEVVQNTYIKEAKYDFALFQKLYSELQSLHELWVAGDIQKEFIKRVLGKYPIKIFDNPKVFRNSFGQGTYTSASDNNQFALHFVYDEDFDKAVELARSIILLYKTPKPLITAAFVLGDEGYTCYHTSQLSEQDQAWVQKLTCAKVQVPFQYEVQSADNEESIVVPEPEPTTSVSSYEIGVQSENEALQRITNLGYAVVPTRSFFHNTGNIKAPMMALPEGKRILPDLLCFPMDQIVQNTPFPRTPFWLEVKFRSYPIWKREEWFHGVRTRNWNDYLDVQKLTNLPVVIMLQEGFSPQVEPKGSSKEEIHAACVKSNSWFWGYLSDLQTQPPLIHNFYEEPFSIWKRDSMKEFAHASFDERTIEANVPEQFPNKESISIWTRLHLSSEPKHSVLLVEPTTEDVLHILSKGIKVYWFAKSYPILSDELLTFTLAGGKYSGMLSIHPCDDFRGEPIVDGSLTEDWLSFLDAQQSLPKRGSYDSFNLGQYQVEHAPMGHHIQVQAGAGSGKTHILVQRILFLLAMDPTLSIEQIGLITFTRDATQEMKKRLINTLAMRFRLTFQRRFLEWLLKTTQMPILTIHSFGRRLIGQLGGGLQLSPGFSLRSYLMEQRKYTHNFIEQNMSSDVLLRLKTEYNLPVHRLEKYIESVWSKIKQKGLSLTDIQNIDWGAAETDSSEPLNALFSSLFATVEARIRSEKQLDDALELSDLTRVLQDLMGSFQDLSQKRSLFRYLFVDEFQDTDPVQIQVIDTLQEALGLWVCAIGDIKQSIYRFRGADYTSFEQIEYQFQLRGESFLKRNLSRNYRTEKGVLEVMEEKFHEWNQRDLLQYESSDRLIAEKPNDGVVEVYSYRSKDNANSEMLKIIERAFTLEKEYREEHDTLPKRRDVVALVRTNKEADELKSFCEQQGIPCSYDKSGDFFRSDAVREFLLLVRALLYPKEPLHLMNFMQSSYSQSKIHWKHFWKANGDKQELLQKMEELNWSPHPSWNMILEKKRVLPVLALLLKAIRELKPADRYYYRRIKQKPENWDEEEWKQSCKEAAKIYHANLYKLLTIFQNNSSADFVSLHSIEGWLSVQQATEYDEHDCELTDEIEYSRHLTIMTVHKSKGLEFNTVVVPYTHREVFKGAQGFVLEKEDGNQHYSFGWSMKQGSAQAIHNDLYARMQNMESQEERKEEARILYVALTRTVRHLLINRCTSNKNHWGSLIGDTDV